MAVVLKNLGKAFLVSKLGGTGGPSFGSLPQYVAWGIGAGTTTVTGTALFTETTSAAGSGGRVTGTLSGVVGPSGTIVDTLQISGTLTADDDKIITNAGVFDAVTAGNLLVAMDFSPITINTSDQLTVIFQIQFP